MKKIFSIFAMAAVVLASCVKEQTPVTDQNGVAPSEGLVEKVFTVSDVESKTYIDGTVANNKIVIKWCADDEISVWDGVANRKFTMVGEPDGASATFKGMVSESATDFYAIYPYDENLTYSYDEANQRMLFTVVKPAVQYANPEGGLADGSAYACGKADENGNIKFLNRSVLLKFSLASGMNVKSVTIKGNEEDDILAGTFDFRYNETTNFTVGWKSAGKSTEITFCNEDGSNLKTGVDHYISLLGNKFDKGYSVTLTFDDGKTITRDSDKSIQYMSNQIYSLASKPLSRTTFGATYFEAYEAGEDIMIAGKAYNKTTHPNATLLTETTTINATGLYFLAPGEGQTITLGTTRVDEMILVGDDPSNRTQIIPNEGFKLKKSGSVAALNVEILSVTIKSKQLIDENGGYAESVVFDNCKIYTPTNSGTSIIYNQVKEKQQVEEDGKLVEKDVNVTATTQTIGEFKMCNCDYVLPEASAKSTDGAIMLNCGTQNTNITLENNLFYVANAELAALKFKVTSVASPNTGSLIMKNNTFINTCQNAGTAGFFTTGIAFTSIDVQNNLFYMTLMDTTSSGEYVFMNGLDFGGGTTLNNYCYKGDNTKLFRMFNGSQNTPSFASTDLTKLTESPFSSMDHTNGVFVKTAAAAAYGAKR